MAIYRTSRRYGPVRPRRKSYKARALLRPKVLTRDARALQGLSMRPPSYYVPGTAAIGGFKETMITTLRYSDNITLQSTSGGVGGNIFRMNSLYDPDFTNLGHQPLYFDQIAVVYQKFTVLSAKLTVTFTPLGHDIDASVVGPYAIGIVGSNTNSFGTTAGALQEANKSVYTTLARDDGGPSVKTLTIDYVPQRDLGLPPSDDTVGADVGANPATPYFAYVWVQSLTSANTSTVNAQVTMEFKTKFWRQGFTAQS